MEIYEVFKPICIVQTVEKVLINIIGILAKKLYRTILYIGSEPNFLYGLCSFNPEGLQQAIDSESSRDCRLSLRWSIIPYNNKGNN